MNKEFNNEEIIYQTLSILKYIPDYIIQILYLKEKKTNLKSIRSFFIIRISNKNVICIVIIKSIYGFLLTKTE